MKQCANVFCAVVHSHFLYQSYPVKYLSSTEWMFQMNVRPSMSQMSMRPLSILTLIAFCNLQRCRQLYSAMFVILILQSEI
jgi:hypothetical protein